MGEGGGVARASLKNMAPHSLLAVAQALQSDAQATPYGDANKTLVLGLARVPLAWVGL